MIQSYVYTCIYWIRHGDSTRCQGMKQDQHPNFFTPSLSTQLMKGCTTPPGSTPPTLYEQQCKFFYVPQESDLRKSCETGPTVLSEKTRMSNLCRCHNKGSTLSSVILRPWVLVRPGIEPATSRSADQRLSNWANRATQSQKLIVFISLLVLFLFLKSTSFFTCRKLIFVVSFLLRTFSRKKVTRHESFT